MRKSRYTEEQIVNALKQADAGMKVEDICRKLGITPTTFYRWKAKFGGMEVNEARRLKQLEEENRRLEQLVANQALDIQMLKAVVRKKMVKPAAGRQAVGYLLRTFGVSERRACRVIGLCRSSYRYEPRREEPMELLQELRQIASERPR